MFAWLAHVLPGEFSHMKSKSLPELLKPEYDVLRVLWKHKVLSVREAHDELARDTDWAYTTTKTVMDRMVGKGLLERSKVHGVFVYKPLISRPIGLARLVQYFADRVLETDYESVVSMFTANKTLSRDELQELRKLLQQQNSRQKRKK